MKVLTLDVETTGLDWKVEKLHGIGVSTGKEPRYYLHGAFPAQLHELLADPNVAKIGQNTRFDLRFLVANGYKIAGPIWDLKSIASLCDENQKLGLKDMSLRILGPTSLLDKAEIDRATSRIGGNHVGDLCRHDLEHGGYTDLIARYCVEDVRNTAALFKHFSSKIRTLGEYLRVQYGVRYSPLDYLVKEATPLENVLLQMELQGLGVDNEAVQKTRLDLASNTISLQERLFTLASKEVSEVEYDLFEVAKSKRKSDKGKAKVQQRSENHDTRFLWTSSAHVGKALTRMAVTLKKTASGLDSTAEKDLGTISQAPATPPLAKECIKTLLDFRAAQKLLTTYAGTDTGVLSRIHEGKIHPIYINGGGPVTGRLASKEPNIQNLPRVGGIKKFFVPDPGHVFLYFDYSQVELRIAAHLSRDTVLLDGYMKGIDLHKLTASNIFRCPQDKVTKEQRQVGKTINFAMIFDASPYRLAEELNKNGATYSEQQCDDMRKAFFNTYYRYKDYLREQRAFIEEHAFIPSECGRIRRLPGVRYREGINWARRTWEGSTTMKLALQDSPEQNLAPEELYWRAKKQYRHAIKMGYNFPVQSLGGSITKRSLIALHNKGYNIITTVHDSIVVQVLKEKALEELPKIQFIMEYTYPISVPLIAEGKVLTSLEETDTLDLETQEQMVVPKTQEQA